MITPGRTLFGAGVVLDTAALAWSATELPDRVATHFGTGGTADSFGSRAAAVWTMAGICLGLAALFVLLALAGPRLPWSVVNVPHKDHWSATPERRRRFWAMFAEDLLVIGGLTLILLAVIQGLVVRANRGSPPALDGWSWVALVLYLAAVGGYCAWLLVGRYRPRE